MAKPERRFDVIQGGTGGGLANTYVDTGVVDENGRPVFRKATTSTGGGAGGGGHAVNIGKLELHVSWLWKAVGTIFVLGLTAIITSYLLLANRIDDRYDKIGGKLDGIVSQISNLRVDVTKAEDGQNADQPQGSSGTRQAGSVHRRTRP